MKFSIVIPVYNVKEYLEECLDSIVGQTYQDYEMILVDDGSTDGSGAMCDRYVQRNPERVRCVHNVNQGQMRARNCGIALATGDICLFVDADDCIREDALALLKERFEQSHCDMVLFNASRERDFSTKLVQLPVGDGQVVAGEEKKVVYERLIGSRDMNFLWLKATRMGIVKALPQIADRFGGRNGEDLLCSLPMVTNADRICGLDQNLYYYRPREGSAVNRYTPDLHRSLKYVHQEMDRYITLWGMQHCQAQHFTKEVKGWMDCLRHYMVHHKRGIAGSWFALLHELAEDEYFRTAYRGMASGGLSRRDAAFAAWLYEKRYASLTLAGAAVRLRRKIRGLLKRPS